MPKQATGKQYVVDYKSVNLELKKKKAELQKLENKVNASGKKQITLQIKAMNFLIRTCKNGKMTHDYTGI